MIYIGTSGWQYDSWRGAFYPRDLKKDEWLPFFSERFPTVEVNNSFYRLPSTEAFARWARDSADGFVVGVKASRFLTHIKRLKEPAEPVALFWSRARELGGKLGPVLFQLPPRFRADLDRLRGLLDVLPDEMLAAVEFRDDTWLVDEVFALLDERGVALVLPDRPGMRMPQVVTGGWSYVRFHQGQPHAPGYTREKLRRWAGRIAGLPARDVYVYFNNDPQAAAVRDAPVMMDLLERRGMKVVRARRDAARAS